MKRRNNRFLAGTLAGLMMLTMLPVPRSRPKMAQQTKPRR